MVILGRERVKRLDGRSSNLLLCLDFNRYLPCSSDRLACSCNESFFDVTPKSPH